MNRSVHEAVGLVRQGIRSAHQELDDPTLRIGEPETRAEGTVAVPFQLAEPEDREWIVGTATIDMLDGEVPTPDAVQTETYLRGHGSPPSDWS